MASLASSLTSRYRGSEPGFSIRPSGGGPDVLVEAEEVGRIVLILERDEPLVVPAVGVLHQLLPLLHETWEVQVHAAVGEAPHVGDALPRPGDVRLVVARLLPVGLYAEQDGRAPVAEGALRGPDPAHSPALVPDIDSGVLRRRCLGVGDEVFDLLVT